MLVGPQWGVWQTRQEQRMRIPIGGGKMSADAWRQVSGFG